MATDYSLWYPDSKWSTSSRGSTVRDKVRVHPYGGPVLAATPRDEVKPIHSPRNRGCLSRRRLSDMETAAIIFAVIGLLLHIAAMATSAWATYQNKSYSVGIFPQCQYKYGCLPVGPVGCAAIVALLYGVSIPVLFTIYTTCCWRKHGGQYVEFATTANCFVASGAVLGVLLMAGFRMWGFPLYGFVLDYSYYLDVAAGVCFLVAGVLFLVHVCLQWR